MTETNVVFLDEIRGTTTPPAPPVSPYMEELEEVGRQAVEAASRVMEFASYPDQGLQVRAGDWLQRILKVAGGTPPGGNTPA